MPTVYGVCCVECPHHKIVRRVPCVGPICSMGNAICHDALNDDGTAFVIPTKCPVRIDECRKPCHRHHAQDAE